MASIALKTFTGLRQSSPENATIATFSKPLPKPHRRVLRINASNSSPRVTGRNLRVAVIGGGPAGGCAAETLAKGGIETFLIERKMDNCKPCGGAIPLCMVGEFDLPLDIIDRRVTKMKMISPSNVAVDIGRTLKPHEYIGMVRREVLDAYLRDRAAAAGATVLNGLFLKMDLPKSPTAPYVLQYTAYGGGGGAGGRRTLEVDAVIGADGANSRVAKSINAGDYEYAIAFQERIRIPDDKMKYYSDLAEMYVGDDVSPDFYGWVFPKCDHVAVGTGTVTHKPDIKKFQLATRVRAASKITGGKIIRVEAHPIPEHPRPRRVQDRVALVGDAAGYVTKCSGEGIYFAAKSGRMCAEAIVEGSENGKRMVDESDLRKYLEKWDKTYWPTYKVLDVLQKVFYRSNPAREAFVEMCADEYVQKMTFDSYLYKKVAPGRSRRWRIEEERRRRRLSMAAALYSSSFSGLFSRSYLASPRPSLSHSSSLSAPFYSLRFTKPSDKPRIFKTTVVFAASASSSDDFTAGHQNSQSKKSGISNLIQDIEPLDVSLIQKDVPLTTIDAMKRTISGMLGLLPSDQFQVLIEALWEPLSKLLVSSMMTGYTLRNAEYRLWLERNLEIYDKHGNKQKPEDFKSEGEDMQLIRNEFEKIPRQQSSPMSEKKSDTKFDIPDFGKMSPEAQQYIWSLQTRLASIKKELREVKRKSAALQMQQFVGEEKNDLLDYLRSLQPEKVAELSEPTSLEVKEAIHSVVHGLLATLSPRMHSKAPDLADNTSAGTVNIGAEDCIDLVENTSLQFQPMISLTRDYLARLLFWCMLLGHYIRGLEYRLELMELLSLPYGIQKDGSTIDQVD